MYFLHEPVSYTKSNLQNIKSSFINLLIKKINILKDDHVQSQFYVIYTILPMKACPLIFKGENDPSS